MVCEEQETLVELLRNNPDARIVPMVRYEDDEYNVLQIDRVEAMDLVEGRHRMWDRTDDIGLVLDDAGETPTWEKCIVLFLKGSG